MSEPKYIHWVILFLTCTLLISNYYCYDIPGTLNTQLRNYLNVSYNEWQYQLNAIYSAYSFPNLVMPIISGILVDSIGPTKMLITFSIVLILGQFLFALAINTNIFSLMIIGRIIAGIGGESLEIAQYTLTTDYFKDKNLGLALGIILTSSQLGTAANDFISPIITNVYNANWAVWFGLFLCFSSLISSIILKNIKYIKHEKSQENKFKFKNIRNLPFNFWLICIQIIIFLCAVNPFNNILSEILQKKYNKTPTESGFLMSIPDIIIAFGSPIIGFIFDKLFKIKPFIRSIFLPISGCLLLLVHVIFGYLYINPVFSLVLSGFAYATFGASLWPLIPRFITDIKILGTAYGISSVALNLSLTISPFIVANLLTTYGFFGINTFFICISILSIIISFIILFKDFQFSQRKKDDVIEMEDFI
jgi:MFS family permease